MSGLVAEVQGLVTANDHLTATLQQLEQQLTSKTQAHSESVRKNQALEDKLETERIKGLKVKEKLELEIKGLKGKLKDKEDKIKVLEKEVKGVKSKAELDARNKVEGELSLLRTAHEDQQRRLIEQFKDTLKGLAVGWTRTLEKDVEVAEKRFEAMMGSAGSMEVDEKEQDGQRFDREEIDPDLMRDHHRHVEAVSFAPSPARPLSTITLAHNTIDSG
jgi:chromosome segregation ATPase